MSIMKKVEIDGKQVSFKASAAIPRIYRIKFNRDIYKDLRSLEKAVGDGDEQNSNLDLFSLEMFENIAYVMAKHADPTIPDTPEEWLDGFNTFLDVLPSEILVGIEAPQISYWRAGGDTELIKTVAKAYPYPHYIKSEVDMSHISILGIMMMTAQYSGDVRVKFSLDNEETYSDEITMDEWLNTDVVELWESLPENKKLFLLFVLHDNATISRFKITYEN